jgi:hypothetical protein
MEWAAGSADFLRGFGISDHVDYAAPLGNAEGGEPWYVLPNEFALHRAIAGGAADDTERAPFCAGDPLHCPGEDGRARTRSGRVLTFHVDILEAGGGFLPGSWDILWSLPVEEMFLSLFSADLPGPARRKLLICAAGRICRDGSGSKGLVGAWK